MNIDKYYAEELFLNDVRCPVCNTKINTENYELDSAHFTTVEFKWGGGHSWFCNILPTWVHEIRYCHLGHGFIVWDRYGAVHDVQKVQLSKKDIFRFVNRVCEHEHHIIEFVAAEERIHKSLSKDERTALMVKEYASVGLELTTNDISGFSLNEINYHISKSIKQRINTLKYGNCVTDNKSVLCELGMHKYIKTSDKNEYLLMCKCGQMKLDRDVILKDIIEADNM